MKLRPLLLAGAAALGPAAGHAGDLVVAVAPVDYVGVCREFGTGYISVPGTDACLSFGGYIESNIWLNETRSVGNYFNLAEFLTGSATNPSNPLGEKTGAVAAALFMNDGYAANWGFSNEIELVLDTKTRTDLGTVGAHLDFEAYSDDAGTESQAEGQSRFMFIDKAYGTIGPLLFGYTDSTFAWSDAGLSLDGDLNADPIVDQIRLSHVVGAWTLAAALEDPRDFFDLNSKNASGNFPSLAFAATANWKKAFFQAALGVTDRTSGTGWGAQLSGQLGASTSPVQLQLNLAYAENAPVYVGGSNCSGSCPDEGSWWSILGSGQIDLTRTVNLNSTATYIEGPGHYEWQAAIGTGWAPTSTSLVSLEVLYSDTDGDDSVSLHGQFKTTFGND